MADAETLHSNPWFSVSVRHEGGQSRYRVIRPDSAMLVDSLPDGRFVLVEGERDTVGGGRLLEFPSGALEPGESAAAAAAREMLEESGYSATESRLLGSVVESPGVSPAACHIHRAFVAPTSPPTLEPGDDWTTVTLALPEVLLAARDGRIRDAGSLAAIALVLLDEG